MMHFVNTSQRRARLLHLGNNSSSRLAASFHASHSGTVNERDAVSTLATAGEVFTDDALVARADDLGHSRSEPAASPFTLRRNKVTDIPTIANLLEEQSTLTNEMERIVDLASIEQRDLLASEARKFDAKNERLREIRRQLHDVEPGMVSEARRLVEQRRHAGRQVPPAFVDRNGSVGHVDEWAEMLAARDNRNIELPLGAVLANKRTRNDGGLEFRDLTTGTTGAPVPITTSSEIYEYLVEGSGVLRSNVRILNTAAGEEFKLPTIVTYSSGTVVSEGSAIPESDPTLETISFSAYGFKTLCQWSNELGFDTSANLGAYLSTNLATALSEEFGPALILGDGTAGPEGLLHAAGTGATGGTGVSGAPSVDDIIELHFSVGSKYRANASWIMSDDTMEQIVRLKDQDDRPILVPGLGDVPATILGRPVYTDPWMPSGAGSKKTIFFGDMSRYLFVRFAGGLRIETSVDAEFERDVVVMRAVQRLDSRVVDPLAGKVFVSGAS